MAWPGDETAGWPGDPGQLRASHADRDQVVDDLKAAFVAGMLAKDELELRVDQVLSSRTYADLADITADLPGALAGEQPPNAAETRAGQPLVQPGQIITGATLLYLGAWLSVPGSAAAALAVLGGFYYLCILAIAVATIFENRHDERSGSQLPKGHAPGAGGLAFPRLRAPVHLITTAALGASASRETDERSQAAPAYGHLRARQTAEEDQRVRRACQHGRRRPLARADAQPRRMDRASTGHAVRRDHGRHPGHRPAVPGRRRSTDHSGRRGRSSVARRRGPLRDPGAGRIRFAVPSGVQPGAAAPGTRGLADRFSTQLRAPRSLRDPPMTRMEWRPAEPWRRSAPDLPIRNREASSDWLSAYS